MSHVSAAIAAALAIATGCTVDDPKQTQDLSAPGFEVALPAWPGDVIELPPHVYATFSDGTRTGTDFFGQDDYPAKDVVYADSVPDLTQNPNIGDGTGDDYYWQVFGIDAAGNPGPLSLDPLQCRRVHVNGAGRIDFVYPAVDASGAPCTHASGVDADGGLTVHLMPYADSTFIFTDTDGVRRARYQIELERVSYYEQFGVAAFGEFFTDAGAGAQTDFDVTLGPVGPVCGNGVVEGDEQCDHGDKNGTAGDSCSATCECLAH
jgi:cysteine-rich repeat protein